MSAPFRRSRKPVLPRDGLYSGRRRRQITGSARTRRPRSHPFAGRRAGHPGAGPGRARRRSERSPRRAGRSSAKARAAPTREAPFGGAALRRRRRGSADELGKNAALAFEGRALPFKGRAQTLKGRALLPEAVYGRAQRFPVRLRVFRAGDVGDDHGDGAEPDTGGRNEDCDCGRNTHRATPGRGRAEINRRGAGPGGLAILYRGGAAAGRGRDGPGAPPSRLPAPMPVRGAGATRRGRAGGRLAKTAGPFGG